MSRTPKLGHRLQPKLRAAVHEEDIKKYAASAMNELLSWYGYEKVDEREAQGLQLRPPGAAPPPAAATASRKRAKLRARTKTPPSDDDSSDSDAAPQDRLRPRPTASPQGGDESRSGASGCAWCGGGAAPASAPEGARGGFCSEQCFAQCRRATFKRSRLCDWCKAPRRPHASAAAPAAASTPPELHDAETQLQFCSEKCLNQCKMSIFCKEAAAHLQGGVALQPPPEAATSAASGGLITPELWLKGCVEGSDDEDIAAPSPSPPPRRSPSPRPHRLQPKIPTPVKPKASVSASASGSGRAPPLMEEAARFWPPPGAWGMRGPPMLGPPMLGPPFGPHTVTVMVPFPVPLPIPIPVPIVLPLLASMPPPPQPPPAASTPPPPPPPEPRAPRKKKRS